MYRDQKVFDKKSNGSKQEIFIGPIGLKNSVHQYKFGMSNPGLGGTEFQLLSLALWLSNQEEFNVRVIYFGEHPLAKPSNIDFVYLPDFEGIFTNDVIVSPVSNLDLIDPDLLENSTIILSSHHPHDSKVMSLSKKYNIKLLRIVGAYSFLACNFNSIPKIYIPNLFLSSIEGQQVSSDSFQKMGTISSFHRSKGTHHVLLIYKKLKKRFKHLELEIIGGDDLYVLNQKEARLKKFAIKSTYVEQLFQLVQQIKDSGGTVAVHGLKSEGLDQIVRNWNFTVINPLGIGESDPASMKDSIAQLIPVFSTGDFGTWDYMRFFPEITTSNPANLPLVIEKYLTDSILQSKVRERMALLVDELISRNTEILTVWKQVFEIAPKDPCRAAKQGDIFRPTFVSRSINHRIIFRNLIFKGALPMAFYYFILDRFFEWRIKK